MEELVAVDLHVAVVVDRYHLGVIGELAVDEPHDHHRVPLLDDGGVVHEAEHDLACFLLHHLLEFEDPLLGEDDPIGELVGDVAGDHLLGH